MFTVRETHLKKTSDVQPVVKFGSWCSPDVLAFKLASRNRHTWRARASASFLDNGPARSQGRGTFVCVNPEADFVKVLVKTRV